MGELNKLEAMQKAFISQMTALNAQNMRHSMDMLHLQQRADKNKETVTTRSNLQKAKHDVMISIANNMK